MIVYLEQGSESKFGNLVYSSCDLIIINHSFLWTTRLIQLTLIDIANNLLYSANPSVERRRLTFICLFTFGIIYFTLCNGFRVDFVHESIDWIWQTSIAELVFYLTDFVVDEFAIVKLWKSLHFILLYVSRKLPNIWICIWNVLFSTPVCGQQDKFPMIHDATGNKLSHFDGSGLKCRRSRGKKDL